MDLMMNLRSNARENKDWATSDKIRDGLLNAGINVKDEKNGASWK
jgi:cysteinyl-tRNA synthetase